MDDSTSPYAPEPGAATPAPEGAQKPAAKQPAARTGAARQPAAKPPAAKPGATKQPASKPPTKQAAKAPTAKPPAAKPPRAQKSGGVGAAVRDALAASAIGLDPMGGEVAVAEARAAESAPAPSPASPDAALTDVTALGVGQDTVLAEQDGGATGGGGAATLPPPNEASALPGGAPAVSRGTRTARVGLFVGREWSFPPEFVKAVERRDAGVVAEYAKIGAPRADEPPPYDLLIDRISHEVPVYRSYLKHAALHGVAVVNDPLMWTADDKFFGTSLADRVGVAAPKTVVLPNRSYVPGIVPEESLRNLEYPLDWQAVVDYVGLPCILKDAHGGGWKEVYVCKSLDELIHHYNESGLLTMIVQEFIEWEHFVRCLVIGRSDVLPMKYDPKARKYIVEHAHMSPELGKRVVDDALKLVRALGYDMNSIEFAIRGGVPYAIDFMNPAPDMDIYSLTPEYFGWAVERMADMAVRLATAARDGRVPQRGGVWAMLERGRGGGGAR